MRAAEPSEIVVDEADDMGPPLTPTTTPNHGGLGGSTSPLDIVAREALKHLPEALETLIKVMRRSDRGDQNRMTAALKVIELATSQAATAASQSQGGQTRVYVLDRGQAAAELVKRLGLRE